MAHTNAGDYPSDPWLFAQTTNYNAANGTVHDQIDRANPDLQLDRRLPRDLRRRLAHAGGSCKGIGGGELAGLDLSGTAHTNAGDYPSDPWSFAQTTNYNAANGTVHDQIDRATLMVSFQALDKIWDGNATATIKSVPSPEPGRRRERRHRDTGHRWRNRDVRECECGREQSSHRRRVHQERC